MKNILIITSSNDLTVDYMINKFNRTTKFFRFNTDLFSDYDISIYDNRGWKIKCKYWELNEEEVFSIYYRKPRFPDISDYEEKYHKLLYKEILTAIQGIVEVFEGRCLSKPSILSKAENKIYQLRIAEKVGFKMPESLITNSCENANRFCSNTERIVKPLSIGKINYDNKIGIIQTNMVNNKSTIENLECSPAYFQQYISKDYEIRVTVIEKKFYGVKIETNEKIDWRKQNSKIIYSEIHLPSHIKSKCIEMMNMLNLEFGAFDFIVSNGEYVFLEVNPNGQWYWLEERLNLDISQSIYNYLVGEI